MNVVIVVIAAVVAAVAVDWPLLMMLMMSPLTVVQAHVIWLSLIHRLSV